MIDVRLDIARMLVADAAALNSSRKYIKVTLFEGEFGSAKPTEEVIKVRNYTQAQANLKRIGAFFRDMNDVNGLGRPRYPQATAITGCKVGAIVITISEMVKDDEMRDAVVYDIPIKDGIMDGYTRKVYSTMEPAE